MSSTMKIDGPVVYFTATNEADGKQFAVSIKLGPDGNWTMSKTPIATETEEDTGR